MVIKVFNMIENKNIQKETKLLKSVFKNVEDKKNLQIILVDNKKIKEMNNSYRGINFETDVLSFPDEEDPKTNGDIFISLDKCLDQAKEFKHSYERELAFLAVHGYLHVKGYDHLFPEDEKVMMDLTEDILKKANLERTYYDWN